MSILNEDVKIVLEKLFIHREIFSAIKFLPFNDFYSIILELIE